MTERSSFNMKKKKKKNLVIYVSLYKRVPKCNSLPDHGSRAIPKLEIFRGFSMKVGLDGLIGRLLRLTYVRRKLKKTFNKECLADGDGAGVYETSAAVVSVCISL